LFAGCGANRTLAPRPGACINSGMTTWRLVATIAAGAVGGALCIGLMEYLSVTAAYPLMTIPFATSIVLVMGTPEAAPAQPRALIGGHLVSALAGLVVLKLAGPSAWAAALAVGVAIAAMHATGTFHPPAGIDALIVVSYGLPWSFLLAPVAAGAILLTLCAYAWHNLVTRIAWPLRWW
jgi:CBS-domain-containing membrane protein